MEIIVGVEEQPEDLFFNEYFDNVKIVEIGYDFSINNSDVRKLILGYSSGDWVIVFNKGDALINTNIIEDAMKILLYNKNISAFCQCNHKKINKKILSIEDIKNNSELLFEATLIKREKIAEIGLFMDNNIFVNIMNFDKLLFSNSNRISINFTCDSPTFIYKIHDFTIFIFSATNDICFIF